MSLAVELEEAVGFALSKRRVTHKVSSESPASMKWGVARSPDRLLLPRWFYGPSIHILISKIRNCFR
jgi:hypothetical protein